MKSLVIILGMVACLFGPAVVFALVGYKAMEAVGKRPSKGIGVLIALVTKLIVTAAVLVSILIVLLRVFATGYER